MSVESHHAGPPGYTYHGQFYFWYQCQAAGVANQVAGYQYECVATGDTWGSTFYQLWVK